MNKGPLCTNKIIFFIMMTWRKTAVNTLNLQSINGFLLACFLSLHLYVSLSSTRLSICFHLYSYLIVSFHLPTVFIQSISTIFLVWITATLSRLPPPRFILHFLPPIHEATLMLILIKLAVPIIGHYCDRKTFFWLLIASSHITQECQ